MLHNVISVCAKNKHYKDKASLEWQMLGVSVDAAAFRWLFLINVNLAVGVPWNPTFFISSLLKHRYKLSGEAFGSQAGARQKPDK